MEDGNRELRRRPLAASQPQAAAAEQIQRGRLLGHERRLALWKNQHARYETNMLRDAGHVSEQDEGREKGVFNCVDTLETAGAPWIDPKNVFVGQNMAKSQRLGRLSKAPDPIWVGLNLGLRKHHADLHATPS